MKPQLIGQAVGRFYRHGWLLAGLGLAFVAALPWLGADRGNQRQVVLIAIVATVVVGLNLTFGFAGELALGQPAVYAVGAYATGVLAVRAVDDLALLIPLGAVAGVVVGLVSGVPGLRLGGWSLAIVSFFLVLLVPDVTTMLRHWTGGLVGLPGIPAPTLFGFELSQRGFYVTVVLTAGLVFFGVRNLVFSSHGVALRVMKQSPVLAASLGVSVYRLKLVTYILSAVPAGIAGVLFAFVDGFIAPDSFGFALSVSLLSAAVIGGTQSVYGALIGTAIIQIGPLRSSALGEYQLIAYGALLVVCGVLFSNGLTGLVQRFIPRGSAAAAKPVGTPVVGDLALPGDKLVVSGVSKHFQGLVALNDVDLTARPGQITALIGPNGSGKTTLLNLISGFYQATGGRIRLGDRPISGLAPHRIARHGIARTFQTPSIPEGLTVLQVVAAARYGKHRAHMLASILRLPAHWRRALANDQVAMAALATVGIDSLASANAAAQPLGTRRLIEVARAVAAGPTVLLLDEPASGLDSAAIEDLSRALRRVRDAGCTVLLVEHNFPLVLRLSDHIVVLSQGRLVAAGEPAVVRHNPQVVQSYLGGESDPGEDPARGTATSEEQDHV